MKTLDPGLPLHLYTETRDPQGIGTRISYTADKLVAEEPMAAMCIQINYGRGSYRVSALKVLKCAVSGHTDPNKPSYKEAYS